ncbi:MAG: hypothetical protein IPK89_09625 [Sphingomonadales bacterium]|nr:hypothetical protein [Sphingomonadales bacterium]
MASGHNQSKRDVLWKRYWAITLDHSCGLCEPIMWHLALRRDYGAMVTLANTFDAPGRMSDPFSKIGLCYRADRGGYEYAAQHLAMEAFNNRDLKGYRYWLRRASRFGDPEVMRQLKRFETRLPHGVAGDIGRRRPYRSDE